MKIFSIFKNATFLNKMSKKGSTKNTFNKFKET